MSSDEKYKSKTTREFDSYEVGTDGKSVHRVKLVDSSVNITAEDIEIGAVEIKNATDDTRAVIKSDGTNNALVVVQNSVPTTTVQQSSGSNVVSSAPSVTGSVFVSNMISAVETGLATSANQTGGGQKTQLSQSNGTALRQVSVTATEKAQAVSVSQDIILSTGNSSVANINYNSTFTGTSELMYQASAIQVFFKADQKCTIYVDQGSASDTFQVTDSYDVNANTGDGRTFTSIAPYFRIRVKNTSITSENTTSVLLQTAMTPILPVLPRALSSDGQLSTEVRHITGDMSKVRISPMGALKTGIGVRLAGASFTGTTPDTNYWASTVVGTGAASVANSTCTLTTGATANSSIILNSVRVARYIGGNPNYYRGNIQLPTVTTTTAGFVNTRRWGAFDANDGYFFEAVQTNPATTPTLRVVSRIGAVDTPVASGSFNGNYGVSYVPDTNVHTYEIWWSNKNAYFFIDNVLIHTITSSSTPAVSTPALKVGLQTINSGDNTALNTLVARSSMIMRLGTLLTQPTSYYFASGQTAGVQLKTGAGNLHSIVFGGAANNAVITLSDSTSAATPAIWVYNATGALAAPVHIDFKGLPFSNGLRLIVATGNASVTVIYE